MLTESFCMVENNTEMNVPENWSPVPQEHLGGADNDLSYEHDVRELRGHLSASSETFKSYIVDGEGEYVVFPEEFDERDIAIERLRQHMEYYS